MNKSKRAALERAGWRVGTTAEFLGLSAEESALVEAKFAGVRPSDAPADDGVGDGTGTPPETS